jgi:hypothetical protein
MPSKSGIEGYDPWADINDDGNINMKDIGYAARLFGAVGDPKKPVVIEEFDYSHCYFEIVLGPGDIGSVNVTTAGYKQITLGFHASPMMPPPYGNISIATGFLMGLNSSHCVYVDRFNATPAWTGPELPVLYEYPAARTYDVTGQLIVVAYYNPNGEPIRLMIDCYLTT